MRHGMSGVHALSPLCDNCHSMMQPQCTWLSTECICYITHAAYLQMLQKSSLSLPAHTLLGISCTGLFQCCW
jgi:hypothetical protein